jgi:hypothetical protein
MSNECNDATGTGIVTSRLVFGLGALPGTDSEIDLLLYIASMQGNLTITQLLKDTSVAAS